MRLLFTHVQRFRFRPRWLAGLANAVLVGTIHSEERHPISRPLMRLYTPVVEASLRYRWAVVVAAVLVVAATIPAYRRLGTEFMPPLNEGALLYMPTTLPGISVTEAGRMLQVQDRILRGFPEVERVAGKIGRAETATDPAPFSMVETVVLLKPEAQWRERPRWYSSWAPDWMKAVLRHVWRDRISWQELVYGPTGLNQALQLPGWSNAWTMPIKNRVDMLSTGVRTPIGIKVLGADLKTIQEIGEHVEQIVKTVPGTTSVFAERTVGGYFLDFDLRREALARYGLTVTEVQNVITSAVGGENVTTTIEGRERYGVSVRYQRGYRDDLDRLGRVLVSGMDGTQIPLAELADLRLTEGPGMIRNENGLLSGYVYVDMAGRDIGRYVAEAKHAVRQQVHLPPGYSLVWSGQYEFMQRVKERLRLVVPIAVFIVILLLHLNTGSWVKTSIIILALPFSAVGAVWLLYLLGYNLSIAVAVGLIALLGVDAETGVFMLLYLDLAYEEARARGRLRGWEDLREAILQGAVKRLRPKVMTVATMVAGLLPIMWSTGAGADVMKRIAAPMVGGIVTSFILELVVYPAVYAIWKWDSQPKAALAPPIAQ